MAVTTEVSPKRGIRYTLVLAYVLVLGAFLFAFARFYIPGKGFSFLIAFGGKQEHIRLDELNQLDYYVQSDSDGYDAQYYAQIAMDPTLRNPQLHQAIDTLAYRGRRILMPAIAYLAGGGQPAAILQVFALENAVAWLLLAGVLLWWFPPVRWDHLIRWAGVLFSFGMCVSVRNSLVDGPSLLLIALGMLAIERNRPWLGSLVLALGGLAKETNLLGAAGLLRTEDLRAPRRWFGLLMRGILVALPLGLWMLYIQRHVGSAVDTGLRNFDWPWVAYMRKWTEVWEQVVDPNSWMQGIFGCGALWSLLMLVALTVQFLFLVLRPTPGKAWWRVGATFAVLMLVLGDAVWEGYPGAASRVLLPMQLAFNVLVPPGRVWWLVLLLGNLTLISAPAALEPPGISYRLEGADSLISSHEGGRFRLLFSPEWYGAEAGKSTYWRWSRGSSTVTLVNPHAYPIEADMDFKLAGLDHRQMTVTFDESHLLWTGEITNALTPIKLTHLRIEPGRNLIRFKYVGEPVRIATDPRSFAFNLRDWVIRLAPAPIDGAVTTGPSSELIAKDGQRVTVDFPSGWYEPERKGTRYWRWSKGPAEWVIHNPHDRVIAVRLSFYLNAVDNRAAGVSLRGGRVLWQGEVSNRNSAHIEVDRLEVPPGETHILMRSNLPPGHVDGDVRNLDLCLRNLVVEALAPVSTNR